MSNIIQSFKNVYISQHNSGYLFDLIISKIIKVHHNYKQLIFNNVHKYKENMIQLQELIFNDSFVNIYNNVSKSGKIDLEEVLIQLNQATVSKFEFILLQDLKNKFQQQAIIDLQEQSQSSNVLYQTKFTENKYITPPLQTQNLKNLTQDIKSQASSDIESQASSDIESQASDFDLIQTHSHQFCSEDSIFTNANYLFKFSLNNAKSIHLDNIKIKCYMYNINEHNNKFHLIEQSSKTLITIPIGYYDINTLLNTISNVLNYKSVNKNKDYVYKAYINTIKNKVCISCETSKDTTDALQTKNILFGISFGNTSRLSNILGFYKDEYFNNNMYMAETHPNINIYDEIYLRLYLNNKEVRRYSSSKKNFYYFQIFDLDMVKSFSKNIIFDYNKNNENISSVFEITQDNLDINELSIEFYDTNTNIINDNIFFKCTITFEYICN